MIEIVLVCALAVWDFTVPPDWTVTKVAGGHDAVCLTIPCGDTSRVPTRVTMKRTAQPDETVTIPKECDEATAKAPTGYYWPGGGPRIRLTR